MKHETHHHKLFVTLLILLVMAFGLLVSRSSFNLEIQTILAFTNALLLLILLHFILEMFSGNYVLKVKDVTPKVEVIQGIERPSTAPKKRPVAKKTGRR